MKFFSLGLASKRKAKPFVKIIPTPPSFLFQNSKFRLSIMLRREYE